MDAQGARVPPTGSRAIPFLHYFLGGAETESEQADKHEALLKLARGTTEESAVREEIVRQRLHAMQQGAERAQPSASLQPPPAEAPLRESAESPREQLRAMPQGAERAQPSAPQSLHSEASTRESVESLRQQLAQMAREMKELRRPKSAPPRPSKKESPDSALLWGGAALGLLLLKKNKAPADPTTPQEGQPPAPPEAAAVEPGLETNPEPESHEPKQAVEQSPAYPIAPAAPDEILPGAEAKPNPPESPAPAWTGPPQTQAESPTVQGSLDAGALRPPRPAPVPTNEDQVIAVVSAKLLRLFRLTGPRDPPKA